MKEKFVQCLSIVIVLLLIFVSVKYFRNGNPISKTEEEEINREEMVQMGEPDDDSKKLAKILKKESGKEIDPKYIVSVGKTIQNGELSFMVDSWEVTKDNPGYPLPKEMTSLEEWPGVILDQNGHITNDFSFVVVHATVNNLTDSEYTDIIWNGFYLKFQGVSSNDFSGEWRYLGEKTPRKYDRAYSKETISGKGKVSIPLIYVVKDSLLENEAAYLEINCKGSKIIDDEGNVLTRWIVLN